MTNEDDLLPQSEKARSILAAMTTLQQAGIDATLEVKPDADPVFSIAIRCATTEGREDLRQSVQTIFEGQWQEATTGLIVFQVKRGKHVELP